MVFSNHADLCLAFTTVYVNRNLLTLHADEVHLLCYYTSYTSLYCGLVFMLIFVPLISCTVQRYVYISCMQVIMQDPILQAGIQQIFSCYMYCFWLSAAYIHIPYIGLNFIPFSPSFIHLDFFSFAVFQHCAAPERKGLGQSGVTHTFWIHVPQNQTSENTVDMCFWSCSNSLYVGCS